MLPGILTRPHDSNALTPNLLVMNDMLYRAPIAPMFSLCVVKAAQRTLVQGLDEAYREEGIRIGLVSVEGPVSADDELMNPDMIAQRTWEFYDQDGKDRTFEMEILGNGRA